MPPAQTFVKFTRKEDIATPSADSRIEFLMSAGISTASLSVGDVIERCAALAWARQHIEDGDDPDEWAASLPDAMVATLLSLYVLPPHKGDDLPPSDAQRLASMIRLYDPGSSALDSPAPQSDSGSIDIGRPGGPTPSGNNTQGSGGPNPPAPSPSAFGSASANPILLGTKRNWLMHKDLSMTLPMDVYSALDTTSGMDTTARAKLQKSFRESDSSAVIDYAHSAPFGHQFSLAFTENSLFDRAKRGAALAAAARTVNISAGGISSFNDNIARDQYLCHMRQQWGDICRSLADTNEISSTVLDQMWAAYSVHMGTRAAHASSWGVPEVSDACAAQYASIPTYRHSIAKAVSRKAATYNRAEAAATVNKTYASFFLPFYWEHILERGRLKAEDVDKAVKDLFNEHAPKPQTPVPPRAASFSPATRLRPAASAHPAAGALPCPTNGLAVPPRPTSIRLALPASPGAAKIIRWSNVATLCR